MLYKISFEIELDENDVKYIEDNITDTLMKKQYCIPTSFIMERI
jgi:hypothetical protein